MPKPDAAGIGNLSQHMLTTMLYTSLKLEVEPVLWMDATAIKEAVERLEDVNLDYFRPLDEVKEQLGVNPGRHMEFLEFGGANALWDLLKKGNSVLQRKCMRAIEVLAKNDAPRKQLREMGIGDTFLDIIRASARRPDSTRRAKSGEILKLLAGSSSSTALFRIPRKRASTKRKPSMRSHSKKKYSNVSSCLYGVDATRETRVPFWYYTTNSVLPWDSETVSSLVDLLLSAVDGIQESYQDAAHRVVKRILYIGQLTDHVVLDPTDISVLIDIITSMHSASIHVVKAVTFASIMHSSNGLAFVRENGVEALVSSLKSDNIGSICGEISAWSVAHFCKTSEDALHRFIAAGGPEALVELSLSSDSCSREAAIHALTSLIRHSAKQRKTILKRLADSDLILSVLNILREQTENLESQAIVHDCLWILSKMAKSSTLRTKICTMEGSRIVERCVVGSEKSITELKQRLLRLLSTRNQRMGLVWKTSNKTGKSIRSRIARKLKKVFRYERTDAANGDSITNERCQSLAHSRSLPTDSQTPTAVEEREISSLSSSVRSESFNGLLATAPEGPAGTSIDEFLDNNPSSKFRTYTTQPFTADHGYDKDFDPFIFGGRPITLGKVEENELMWSLMSSSDPKDELDDCANPELIETGDFI